MAQVDIQSALDRRAQVEAFQRRHRIGLLTLVFTDIVGSTRLKQDLGDADGFDRIQAHHAAVRETLKLFPDGEEIGTAGDSFFLVFAKPSEAVRFALLLQARLRELAQAHAGGALPLFDRVGIHIGEVIIEERAGAAKSKDLYGIQVDICARVMSVGEGDQVLLTRSAFDNARQVLRSRDVPGLRNLVWLNHGLYALHGVEEPLEICEVGEEGLARLRPPPDSEKVRRFVSANDVRRGGGGDDGNVPGTATAAPKRWASWRRFVGAAIVLITAVVIVLAVWRPWDAAGRAVGTGDAYVAAAGTAGAVLQRIGFEASEGYRTDRPLVGQQGWTRGGWPGQLASGGDGVGTGLFGAAATGTAGAGASTQQAFIGGVAGVPGPAMHASLSRRLRYTPVPGGSGRIVLAWRQMIRPSSGGGVGNHFEWLVYNQSGQLLAGINFDAARRRVLRRAADNSLAPTPLEFETGRVIDVALRLDLAQNRWGATIGSDELVAEPIATDVRPLNVGGMSITWRSGGPGQSVLASGPISGDNLLAFDDLIVTTTPRE